MNLKTKLWLLIIASTLTGLCLFIAAAWMTGSLFNQGYTHVELNEIGDRLAAEAAQSPPDQAAGVFERFSG